MRRITAVFIVVALAAAITVGTMAAKSAADTPFQDGVDLVVDGAPWLRTIAPEFNRHKPENTYKVFTHLLDYTGEAPLTKGPGGRYTHHRGLFIGWNHTRVGGRRLDTWHMRDCYQEHVAWEAFGTEGDTVFQRQQVGWYDLRDAMVIEETREIRAQAGPGNLRIIDFHSTLESRAGDIELRGDLHHAGMQVRMANEVTEHEETTRFILPEGAEELDNDEVVGAWWACASVIVGGERYWVMHMTPPDHPTGEPVYSIRRYARFGAFFEPNLQEGVPLPLRFRVVLSDSELDREACQALYDAYAETAAR